MKQKWFNYGQVSLSAMIYTFKCDNKGCEHIMIRILCDFVKALKYYGICTYCKSGKLKLVDNNNLHKTLRENMIIHEPRDL